MPKKKAPVGQPTLGLPDHVRDYFRRAFAAANHFTANLYSENPAMHEEWLDGSFIHRLREWSTPVRLDEGWVVHVGTHYLGGRRHWHNWEIADIGLIVVLREKGLVTRVKVAVLQSKRLYPDEISEIDELGVDDYVEGLARLMPKDDLLEKIIGARTFRLNQGSRYRALSVKDDQWKNIEDYEKNKFPVHYLFYHPVELPWEVCLPLQGGPAYRDVSIGAHVLRAKDLRTSCNQHPIGYTPSYADIHTASHWSIENFVADEVLTCREGTISKPDSQDLFQLFYRRSGPIAAGIALTIDVPPRG